MNDFFVPVGKRSCSTGVGVGVGGTKNAIDTLQNVVLYYYSFVFCVSIFVFRAWLKCMSCLLLEVAAAAAQVHQSLDRVCTALCGVPHAVR